MTPRRCLLFVPGNRPERFLKAIHADADQVCLDLEDAVAPPDKASARAAVVAFLQTREASRSEVGVRINTIASGDGRADLVALAGAARKPDFVMLPKIESADEIAGVAVALPRVPLIAQIESPEGAFQARAIASAPNVQALMFGGYDYAVAARMKPNDAGWAWPRAQIAAAAAAARVGAIDVPSIEVKDVDRVAADTSLALTLGFTSRAAIHPAQVPAIQQAFLPTAGELAHAERVIAASDAAQGGVAVLDGRMVDRPLELAARSVKALSQLGLQPEHSH
jgi:citrate lyase subunit beta/citryl-CoA lyase/(S)-citramalyl-CoA lyase